jgi:spermidine synthase
MSARALRAVVLACFFASGCAGLVYEICWIRRASLVFGSTTLAVSTVIAIFFLGLALGSELFGRNAARIERPLRAFAILELAVGGLALLTLPAFAAADALYGAVYPALSESRALLHASRIVIAALILLPPTVLMGGTLPLFCRELVTSQSRIALSVGLLYGVNTLGAAAGCAVAGFWLLPALGLARTLVAGVALSVSAGVLVLATARTRVAPQQAASPSSARPRALQVHRFVYAAFFVAGFVALGAEVLWTRFLALLMHNTVYTYTITLSVVLLGIVLGSVLVGAWSDRWRARALVFGLLHVLTGLAVLGVMLLPPAAWARLGSRAWIFALLLLPPSILSGASFPLGMRMLVDNAMLASRGVGRLVALNTLGGILGAFAVGFGGVPVLGMQRTLLILTGMSVAVGIGAWLLLDERAAQKRAAAASARKWVLVAASVALWLLMPRVLTTRIPQDHLADSATLVDYKEGVTANLAVLRQPGFLRLEIDKLWQGESRKNHQALAAHIPMLLHPDARNVLVVGAGAGQTPARFLMHGIDRLDCVDIEPAVFDVIREHFDAAWMSDPRVRLVRDDGRSFVAHARSTYDVISLEVGQIQRPGVAFFYTRDFYEQTRARLAPGGYFSQFVPLPYFGPDAFRSAIRTFLEVFPQSMLWYNTSELLLIGVAGDELHLDESRLRARLAAEPIASDLAYRHWGDERLELRHPDVFLASFLTGPAGLREIAAGGDVYRDDRPVLDYAASHVREEDANEIPVVEMLRSHLEPVESVFDRGSAPHADAIASGVALEDSSRSERGDRAAIRALQERNLGDIVARALVTRATHLLSTRNLPEIARTVEEAVRANEDLFVSRRMLAEVRVLQGRFEEALEHYNTAIRIRSDDAEAQRGSGAVLLYLRRPAEAIPRFEAALALEPDDAKSLSNLGAALGMQGRFEEGIAAIERALRIQPDFPDAADNLARMRAAMASRK